MNTQAYKPWTGAGLFLMMALLVGCAGMPENDLLTEARQDVERAQQTRAVSQHAAVKLQEAENSLRRAETLWEEEGRDSIEEVEHHAYLARQQALTAMQRGALGEAENQVAEAREAREQVLRESRERELQTAQERLAEVEREAEMAQQSRSQEEDDALAELQATVEDLQAQQTERGTVLTLRNVLFDFGKAEVKPGAERSIEQLAAYLEESADRRLLVEGYTDSVGDPEFNEQLSEQRAEAVREQLVTAGIDPDRIEAMGHGENYPVASNETPYGRQLNRRVEVVVAPTPNEAPEPRSEQEEGGDTTSPGQ